LLFAAGTLKSGVPVERAVDSLFDLHLTGERGGFLVNLGMAFVFFVICQKKEVLSDLIIKFKKKKKKKLSSKFD
jgi:hypothetical protein